MVLPLITKRCSVNKEEGDEELMESILLDKKPRWNNLAPNQESIIGIFRTNSVKWEREKEEGGLIPVSFFLLHLHVMAVMFFG